MPGINRGQIARIHQLAQIIGMSDEDRRSGMRTGFGVTSSKDLNDAQAREYIRTLERTAIQIGKQPNKHHPQRWDHLGKRPRMASPAQLRMIETLWKKVSRARTNTTRDAALRVFIENHFERSSLEMIESALVGKIIQTLRAMARQGSPSKSTNGADNGNSKRGSTAAR